MTASGPITANNMDGDLLSRQQVAYLFQETSAKVAMWARRGMLPEVRDDAGKPRYQRADVEALLRARAGRRRPP
jgi:predicted site-specific integrase-resolvase